ncbi:MAG: hypothetical protein OEX07_09910 [Gammaproteobacteria bacterium]|nr:hypothetical protein [Gammaproteobacteria bacterium]
MIFIVCALHCEAKPIVERYRLVVDREASFPVFKGDGITLVVTGIGKILTASAMSYLYARYNEPFFSGWLNVGIAGMKSSPLGELYNINKITEQSSGANWYPVRLPVLDSAFNCPLITVDKPDNQYIDDFAYDMEASAFALTALRYSPVELMQVVKIVSDNENNSMENIDKKFVTKLVSSRINEINNVVTALGESVSMIEQAYAESGIFAQCVDTWHFSEYQKKQLSRLVQQWEALDDSADFFRLEGFSTGKQVVEFLNKALSETEIVFGDLFGDLND